jgi:hypothetical protein
MTGLSEVQDVVNSVLWKDAEFERITIDYDTVAITLKESTGLIKEIRCRGYIGYHAVGLWDEVVVDAALVFFEHPLIEESLQSIRKRYRGRVPESGSPGRNAGDYFALEITLDDGARVLIAAASIDVTGSSA